MRARAWIGLLVGASLIVIAAAVASAASSREARLAEDAGELARAERLLSTIAVLRSDLGIAVTLIRTSAIEPAYQSGAQAAVDATVEAKGAFVEAARNLDDFTIDVDLTEAMAGIDSSVDSFASAETSQDADEAARSVLDTLDDLEPEISVFRTARATAVHTAADRAGNLIAIAGFTVAIVGPITLVFGVRFLAQRRELAEREATELRRRERVARSTIELAEDVSRRLMAPLTGVHGLGRIMANVLDGTEKRYERAMLREVAAMLMEESTELARALDDLVAYARIADHTLKVDGGPSQPSTALEPMMDELDDKFEIVSTFESGNVACSTDHLRHIVRNAIRAASEVDPSLEVRGAAQDHRYRISVAYAAETTLPSIPRIIRGAGSIPPAGSIELGLAVARGLAEAVDGSIDLIAGDETTRIEIDLPLAGDW